MGMNRVTFVTKAFSLSNTRLSESALSRMLNLLYNLNLDFLHAFPNTPTIYDPNLGPNRLGLRYREEPLGEENWEDIPTIIEQGYGDCEDLACARAAELTVSGIPSVPFFTLRRYGDVGVYHILVRRGDGQTEDPSYALGMRPSYRHATHPNSNGRIWRE